MSVKKIDVSAAAKADIYEIFRYLYPRSRPAAKRLRDEITNFYRLLERNPQMGKSAGELYPGLRSFPVQNYMVYYFVHEETIEIVRMLHTSRFHVSEHFDT